MNTDFVASQQLERAGTRQETGETHDIEKEPGFGLHAHVIFDRAQRVVACDEDARHMASLPAYGISMDERFVRMRGSAADELIAQVAAGVRPLPKGGVVVPITNRTVNARVVPLIRGGTSPFGPLYLLTLNERLRVTNYIALARRLGLTMAEAGIVDALCGGMRVAEYARVRRIETGTVRTQLKSIYRKLAVHGQVALVSYVQRVAEGEE